MKGIERALVSCTDKTGVVDFCRFLAGRGVEILSTGGTARLLRDGGVAVTEVADHIGAPEILDGRVKTLHPKIHGGILARRDDREHNRQMQENDIQPIDLVVVNLYEFEKTVARVDCSLADAVENIDIGGPSMLRSAAKNHHDVAVVVEPADYARVQAEIEKTGGVPDDYRFELAAKAFAHTARYDAAISRYLTERVRKTSAMAVAGREPVGAANTGTRVDGGFPERLTLSFRKHQDLRYGENPHQGAAFYADDAGGHGIAQAEQLQGKELSFNNILDLDAALSLVREFTLPTCVIVKHTNPCGTALAERLSDAFIKARSSDPVSSFGGIIGLNRAVDECTAGIIAETFFEAVIAPDFSPGALAIFKNKRTLRLLKAGCPVAAVADAALDLRRVSGGLLVQTRDAEVGDVSQAKTVSQRSPSPHELVDLTFAWTVVKHVKSNAIVIVKDGQTIGVGAGQMSRVDAVKLAIMKARENFKDGKLLKGAVLASDAFFPFRDGLDEAVKAGIKAVIQPGGSMRDEEVIAAAREHGIAMIFTGVRHFRH